MIRNTPSKPAKAGTGKTKTDADKAAEKAQKAAAAARAPTLRAEFYSLPPEALVDRTTVAAVRYLTPSSIEKEAVVGGGIAYTVIGRRALYRKRDVQAFLDAGQRVTSTAERGAA